jgi:hypothetical protein
MADALDEAALDFARFCLKQPDSFIGTEPHQLQVRPDGFNIGPESFADCGSLDYEDLRLVLPLVAHWCSLNDIRLEIMCSSSLDYQCRFTEGNPVNQLVETNGSSDLCLELLAGASHLAQCLKSVESPHPSMSRAEFFKGKPETG